MMRTYVAFMVLLGLLTLHGEAIHLKKGTSFVKATEITPLRADRHYRLKLNAKGGKGKLEVKLWQFTAGKREIGAYNIRAQAETETTIAEEIKAGSKEFLVADASKWKVPQMGNIVVFNSKPDLSDLPNFNIAYYVKSVEKIGDKWKIGLSKPVGFNVAAGSGVRLHSDGDRMSFDLQLPISGQFTSLIRPASMSNGSHVGYFWKGSAFAQIYLRTDSPEPVEITDIALEEIEDAEIDEMKKREAARVLAEEQRIRPYGHTKIFKDEANCWEFNNVFDVWAGIAQKSIEIRAAQFECDFKSPVPGFVQFRFTQVLNGKKVTRELPVQSVIPDNEYRRYRFSLADSRGWEKDSPLVGWSFCFRYYMERDRRIGFRNPVLLEEENMLVGAAAWQQGKPLDMPDVRPLGKYRLGWKGGTCPGVELRFYDYMQRRLPESVKLNPGEACMDFSVPEMTVKAQAVMLGKGKGVPRLTTVDFRRRYTPEVFWRGQWIWTQLDELGPFFSNVCFCKEFDLPEEAEMAVIAVMADDQSETRVNGQLVGFTWQIPEPKRYMIGKYLKPGRNKVEIRVYNGTLNAGLCSDIYVRLRSGKEIKIETDRTWRWHHTGKRKDFPSKYENAAVELGAPASTPPWASTVRFAYAGPQGEFDLKESENGEFRALLSHPVLSAARTMKFERRSASGKKQEFLLPVEIKENKDGTVTVKYPKIRPMEEASQVYLNDDFWNVKDNKALASLPAQKSFSKGLQKAELVGVGRRVMIKFNGRLYDPAFLQTSEYERMAPALKQGFCNFVVSAPFNDFWLGEGKYDFIKLDSKIERLLTVAPDGVFLLDIRFWMPEWWLKQHPDDTTVYANPKQPRDTYMDMQALGSKNWLAATDAPLQALITHVSQSFYADRIWGAHVGESRNGEWFWNRSDNTGKFAVPGFSPSELKAFRQGLKKRYGTDEALARAWNMPGLTFDNAQFPDPELRKLGEVGGLHDPLKQAQVMDWYRFRNDVLTEAILYFASRVKALTDRKWLTGAYYGYWNTLSSNSYRPIQISGHNGTIKCAKCPDLDFFRAPSFYTFRKVGMANSIMQTVGTCTLRGKMVLVENDERNAFGPREGTDMDLYASRNYTCSEAVGCVDREFGMAAALGVAGYWLDHPRGSLYEPALLAAIGEQLKFNASRGDVQELLPPEMALVGDEESVYYATADGKNVFISAVNDTMMEMNKLAVPYRNILAGDLLDGSVVPPHKFYIMLPTLALSAEQRRMLMERFSREKATVLWLYAAGPIYPEKGLDGAFNGDFLGLKCTMDKTERCETLQLDNKTFTSSYKGAPHFYAAEGYDSVICKNAKGKAVIVEKRLGDARHIFSTLPALPGAMLRQFAEESKVFCYGSYGSDQWWIGNDVIFLHAATGGTKKARLPFNARMEAVIGPLRGTIPNNTWQATPGLTYGFRIVR
ncbi:MAG: beta-galactosidase [Victivallales bacterium]|nr:beta-galactosidase [Victivallales bacterium]